MYRLLASVPIAYGLLSSAVALAQSAPMPQDTPLQQPGSSVPPRQNTMDSYNAVPIATTAPGTPLCTPELSAGEPTGRYLCNDGKGHAYEADSTLTPIGNPPSPASRNVFQGQRALPPPPPKVQPPSLPAYIQRQMLIDGRVSMAALTDKDLLDYAKKYATIYADIYDANGNKLDNVQRNALIDQFQSQVFEDLPRLKSYLANLEK